jgi:hypothetical protein
MDQVKDAQRIMNDFTKLGAMVDIMFPFVAYLVAEYIPADHTQSVIDGYKKAIKEIQPEQYDMFASSCDRFQKGVDKYREAIKEHADESNKSPSPKTD